jgi:hypothetical protein
MVLAARVGMMIGTELVALVWLKSMREVETTGQDAFSSPRYQVGYVTRCTLRADSGGKTLASQEPHRNETMQHFKCATMAK